MIDVKISAALNSLEAQVIAAQPLANANRATITALQLNAVILINLIQSSLTAVSLLDTWIAPIDPAMIVNGVLAVNVNSDDLNFLSLMRGVVGRASFNLNQLV